MLACICYRADMTAFNLMLKKIYSKKLFWSFFVLSSNITQSLTKVKGNSGGYLQRQLRWQVKHVSFTNTWVNNYFNKNFILQSKMNLGQINFLLQNNVVWLFSFFLHSSKFLKPLAPMIWWLILPSSCYAFPCEVAGRIRY